MFCNLPVWFAIPPFRGPEWLQSQPAEHQRKRSKSLSVTVIENSETKGKLNTQYWSNVLTQQGEGDYRCVLTAVKSILSV